MQRKNFEKKTQSTLHKDPPTFFTVAMTNKPWHSHATHVLSEKYIVEQEETDCGVIIMCL